ncbi:helix-turn-helix domain-containing protein [Thermodesulfobacteriota bacterium]
MESTSNITPESIRKFRAKRGLSQQRLASILNVGIATVSRWEHGQKKPSGTAAAVLETLLSDGPVDGIGPVASGFAIYKLLKERVEPSESLTKIVASD